MRHTRHWPTMSDFEPRRLLNLDEPSQHLTGRQFAIACTIITASAVVWGLLSRSWLVGGLTIALQLPQAWRTPVARERTLPRILVALGYGALFAALALVARAAQHRGG